MLLVKNLKKSFGENVVLKDVSFELKKGEVKVLMGTNGSGKTTMFNIISGFLKADSGEVLLNNENLFKYSPFEINKKGINRTFQDMRLIGELTVLENVLLAFKGQEGEKWWKTVFPLKKIKQEQKTNNSKANDILKTCFIDDVAESKAGEISYGQQKLLNLACCMANNPDILLLDEPVASVNIAYREKLSQVIQQLKAQDKALLIIEHNTDFIETIADRILFLNEGVISEFESYDAFKQDENVKNAYV